MKNADNSQGAGQFHIIKDRENPKNSKLCMFLNIEREFAFWEGDDWLYEKITFDGSEFFATHSILPALQFSLIWAILDWSDDEVAFQCIYRDKDPEKIVNSQEH